MEKIFLPLFFVLITNYCFGQTNTFPASGNVGIGTTTPGSSLEIRSDKQRIQLGTGINTSAYSFMLGVNDDGVNFENNSYIRGFNFKNPYGVLLSITQGGNVGIGTTSPQSKLAVSGTVTAKQVKVTLTGWPDYVFDTAYTLLPIDRLADYIQQYKHLPQISSAKEVADQGLDLGDMQSKQMEKIEELTLYIIRQNQVIDKQQKVIEGLSERVSKIECKEK